MPAIFPCESKRSEAARPMRTPPRAPRRRFGIIVEVPPERANARESPRALHVTRRSAEEVARNAAEKSVRDGTKGNGPSAAAVVRSATRDADPKKSPDLRR